MIGPLAQALCLLAVLAAVVLTVLGLPGTLIIAGAAAICGFATGFQAVSVRLLLVLIGLSLFAELADNLIGLLWAKRWGASTHGLLGSVAGAVAGAVVGSAIVPIIGTVVGALVGSFAGAWLLEYHRLRDSRAAVRAGWGAFAGRLTGIALKLAIVGLMAVVFLRAAW